MKPTYLYIKKHSITGLKYFGKTTQKDPYAYIGSGTYWRAHVKKYGRQHIITEWVSEPFTNKDLLVEYASNMSNELNIVKSNEWANLVNEDGIAGIPYGTKLPTKTQQHRNKLSNSTIYSFIHKTNITEKCSAYELRIKYNLNPGNLYSVIKELRTSHKGWKLNIL
jgi:hypothetical protein